MNVGSVTVCSAVCTKVCFADFYVAHCAVELALLVFAGTAKKKRLIVHVQNVGGVLQRAVYIVAYHKNSNMLFFV